MQIAQADLLGLNSKFSKLLSANIWWKRIKLLSFILVCLCAKIMFNYIFEIGFFPIFYF